MVIVSRAVLRTNSLTRDSAFSHRPQRLHELGGIGDPPDGPYGHFHFLAVGRGNIDQLLGLACPVPDLERLGKPEHFLDEGQLQVESWPGLAGDRLAELQEHGQLPLVDGIEESPAQGDDQDQEHANQDGDPLAASHGLSSPFESRFKSGRNCLRSASMMVLFFTL